MTDGPDTEDAAADLRAVRAWARAARPDLLVLVCREHPDPASAGGPARQVVRLRGCLGRVSRASVVELLLDGVGAVHLEVGGCADPDRVRERVADLEALFDAQGTGLVRVVRTDRSAPVPVLDAGDMPLPRRVLLGLVDDTAAQVGADRDHRRLVGALEALLPDEGGAEGAQPAVPGPRLDPHRLLTSGPGVMLRAAGCTACGVCVRTCPEGALDLTVRDGVGVLTHRPRSCSGSGVCVGACPVGALTVRRPARWAEQLGGDRWVPLATVETITCRRCGAVAPDAGDGCCEVCAFRRATPFGSSLPPAAAALLAARTASPAVDRDVAATPDRSSPGGGRPPRGVSGGA